MIATDGSDGAIAAARRALALLHPDARVELVTIVAAKPDPEEDATGFAGPLLTEDEAEHEWHEATEAGRAALRRTIESLGGAVDEAKVVPSDASVDAALVALVREERPDLLVLGSHHHGWFDRVLNGSTEDRLLHQAPCPLLIVTADG
jgi:nucleotide-binding universal stress UspA family protein